MNKTLLVHLALPSVTLALLALLVGCKQEAAAPAKPAPAPATPPLAVAAKPAAGVAKIVFVGKQDACDCTRKRIDDSLAALQAALGDRDVPPVERLQVDVDQAGTATYNEMRSIMVLPAVYLLDGAGELKEMLQGEVSEEQFRVALGLPEQRPPGNK